MFAPHQLHFLEGMEASGMKIEEYIDNIQTLMDRETVATLNENFEMNWNNYYLPADVCH